MLTFFFNKSSTVSIFFPKMCFPNKRKKPIWESDRFQMKQFSLVTQRHKRHNTTQQHNNTTTHNTQQQPPARWLLLRCPCGGQCCQGSGSLRILQGVLFMAVVSQLMLTLGGCRVYLAAQLSTSARLPLTRTVLWLWRWLPYSVLMLVSTADTCGRQYSEALSGRIFHYFPREDGPRTL